MGKSLTEVAKAILMNESNDSAPDAGAKSSNPNMATLKPGGGSKGGVEPSPMGNQATLVADAPKKPGEGDNVGAKAATMKQDTSQASPSRKGAVPAMPPQKEVMEEDSEFDGEQIDEAGMMPTGINRKLAKVKALMKARSAEGDARDAEKYFPSSANPIDRSINKKEKKRAETARKVYKRLEEDTELDEDYDPVYKGVANTQQNYANKDEQDRKREGKRKKYINQVWTKAAQRSRKKAVTGMGELSEELEAFIDQMIEEGYDEDQIAQAIDENFEFIEEGLEVVHKDTGAVVGGSVKPKPGPGGSGPGMAGRTAIKEEDNLELSEELEAFIDQMIEEGYDEDEIAAAIEENFEFVTEEPTYYDYEVDMNEHVEALFAGEDLSEEFMNKAKTIFEAAVVAKMQSEIARLEEAYAATLEEEVGNIQESLTENVDDYLNYVVENWVSENEVAIEAGLRTELTEEFISGLRQLFAEHYIDIPEDKISVVEELGSKIEELETKLNEEIERNVELTNILSESVKNEIMHNMTEGLTATQAEKLKSLSEGVEFVDVDSYATKIQTLRENYFPSGIRSQTELDRIEPGTEGQTMIAEDVNNPMSKYVRALGKTLPN